MVIAEIDPSTSNALMHEIQKIEKGTDLKNVSVISRVGMRIATAQSAEMDADPQTASSSALIDLAERLTSSVNNGGLREILVKAASGFVILQFVNDQFMLFGGIENPLRIGYYMEYLRNVAHRFAYILAGNKLTDELKKEIEANNEREARLKEEAKAPIAANFTMDKDSQADIAAMEGVLDFLKDWGEEEVAPISPSENNVIGIDNDMMFEMGNLQPTSISEEQIKQAQSVASTINKQAEQKATEEENLDDILAALDHISESSQPTISDSIANKTLSSDFNGKGLPDDVIAALDDIADETPSIPTVSKKKEKTKDLPFGVPIYEGEVPPIPLKDYVSFELGSLSANYSAVKEPSTTNYGLKQSSTPITAEDNFDPYTIDVKHLDDGTPDFNSISSEYDDIDLDIEEDAMLQALAELDISPSKKKKK